MMNHLPVFRIDSHVEAVGVIPSGSVLVVGSLALDQKLPVGRAGIGQPDRAVDATRLEVLARAVDDLESGAVIGPLDGGVVLGLLYSLIAACST